jgi:hypothetical protein
VVPGHSSGSNANAGKAACGDANADIALGSPNAARLAFTEPNTQATPCNNRIKAKSRSEAVLKLSVAIAAALSALVFAAVAQAAPPTLLNVGQQNRHPTATFSAPGADFATIYLATKPDRASDGSFLTENIEEYGFLTNDEIQRGVWLDASQVDPGLYYVLLQATDYDCLPGANCTAGYSEMKTLDVPKPQMSYRGRVSVLHYIQVVYLTLTVRPLGERLPYRVCWRLKSKRRRCVSGAVNGYSWNSSASQMLSVGMRGMGRLTRFTWYVAERAVAVRTANTTKR